MPPGFHPSKSSEDVYRSQAFEDVVADVDIVRDLIGGETQLRSWKELFDAGQLSVEVEVFPISQVKQAVEKGRAGHTRGKIVLNLRQ